jgi:hypothetical protein
MYVKRGALNASAASYHASRAANYTNTEEYTILHHTVSIACLPVAHSELEEQRRKQLTVYPLPEPSGTCVVCTAAGALFQCSECPSKICTQCALSVCYEAPLLFHQMHCLRFGAPPAVPQHARPHLPLLQLRGVHRATGTQQQQQQSRSSASGSSGSSSALRQLTSK